MATYKAVVLKGTNDKKSDGTIKHQNPDNKREINKLFGDGHVHSSIVHGQ